MGLLWACTRLSSRFSRFLEGVSSMAVGVVDKRCSLRLVCSAVSEVSELSQRHKNSPVPHSFSCLSKIETWLGAPETPHIWNIICGRAGSGRLFFQPILPVRTMRTAMHLELVVRYLGAGNCPYFFVISARPWSITMLRTVVLACHSCCITVS